MREKCSLVGHCAHARLPRTLIRHIVKCAAAAVARLNLLFHWITRDSSAASFQSWPRLCAFIYITGASIIEIYGRGRGMLLIIGCAREKCSIL